MGWTLKEVLESSGFVVSDTVIQVRRYWFGLFYEGLIILFNILMCMQDYVKFAKSERGPGVTVLISRITWKRVNYIWHTAWQRTWRPWRKTSGSKTRAVSSSVLLEKRESCCSERCWSETSSPGSLSLEGGSSPLRRRSTKTWLVWWQLTFCPDSSLDEGI